MPLLGGAQWGRGDEACIAFGAVHDPPASFSVTTSGSTTQTEAQWACRCSKDWTHGRRGGGGGDGGAEPHLTFMPRGINTGLRGGGHRNLPRRGWGLGRTHGGSPTTAALGGAARPASPGPHPRGTRDQSVIRGDILNLTYRHPLQRHWGSCTD